MTRMNAFLSKALLRKSAFGYTILILLLVTLPLNGEDQLLGNLNDNYVLQIRFDYISHVLLFIPWIVLIWWGWDLAGKSGTMQALLLLGGLGFSTFCEYIQLPLTYRTFNANDLLANSLGVLLGFLLLWVWKKISISQQMG